MTGCVLFIYMFTNTRAKEAEIAMIWRHWQISIAGVGEQCPITLKSECWRHSTLYSSGMYAMSGYVLRSTFC